MTRTKMVECEPCRGTGFAPYTQSRIRCGTCHGAGEIEVWDDEPITPACEENRAGACTNPLHHHQERV